MPQLQFAFAVLGAGLTFLVIALLARDARRVPAVRFAIPLFLSALGYSLILLHETLGLPLPLLQTAVVLNAFAAPLGWLFGRALLDDDFAPGRLDWAVLAVLTGLAMAADADVFGLGWAGQVWIERAAFVSSLAVMAHVSWIAFSGFRGDLINVRRLARVWFLTFVLLSYVLLIVLDALGISAIWRGIAYDLTTVAVSVSIILLTAELRFDRLSPPRDQAPLKPSLKPQQTKAYRRLIELMETERLYRQPGLGIRTLAARVGTPEHRLRALINGALGYRNFAAFLNGYRLAEARAALSDPDSEKSILLIALDSGYRSLSTFNRAFQRQHGETPSDFRRRMSTRPEPGESGHPT